MKLYMKVILLVIGFTILLMTTGFGLFYQSEEQEKISEEAIPIRTEEVTTGLDYRVTIGKQVQDKKIILSSHILDSILHYKEIPTIDHFLIQLKIENHTVSSYLLKNISIVDTTTNIVVEDIPYTNSKNNTFFFYIEQSFFQKYKKEYVLLIELEK